VARRRKPLQVPGQTHWLIVTDPFRKVVECCVLSQDVNVQQAMHAAIERWVADGWEAEGDGSYEFCFIQRAGQRLLLNITQTDPNRPPSAGHAFLAGQGSVK
jgi:hypothetical protein